MGRFKKLKMAENAEGGFELAIAKFKEQFKLATGPLKLRFEEQLLKL